jgi:hypothetical protein
MSAQTIDAKTARRKAWVVGTFVADRRVIAIPKSTLSNRDPKGIFGRREGRQSPQDGSPSPRESAA